jgi:hypothetical protein
MEILKRKEAEKLIKESLEDYLSDDNLQDILNIITGEDYLVVDAEDEESDEFEEF